MVSVLPHLLIFHVRNAALRYVILTAKLCHPGKHPVLELGVAFPKSSKNESVTAIWLEVDGWEVEPLLVPTGVVVVATKQLVGLSDPTGVLNTWRLLPKCKVQITGLKLRPKVDEVVVPKIIHFILHHVVDKLMCVIEKTSTVNKFVCVEQLFDARLKQVPADWHPCKCFSVIFCVHLRNFDFLNFLQAWLWLHVLLRWEHKCFMQLFCWTRGN